MKLIKFLLKSVLALFIIFILAIVALIVFIDPNDYKPEISELVKENTGRDLLIEGDIAWSFFPRLGFKIGRTEISNAAGFNSRVFAEVDNIDAGLQIKPLLSGEVVVDVITLQGMTANLEIKADGSTNWDDLSSPQHSQQSGVTSETNPAEPTPELSQPETSASDLDALPPISLGGLEIIDARVTYTDVSGGIAANLDNFNFTTGKVVLWDPIDFEGSFFVENKFPELKVNVDYEGTLIADLPNNKFGIHDFIFNMATKGESIPNGGIDLSLAAEVSANTETELAKLESLSIKFDDTTISGTANITNFSTPAIDFKVDIDQLNADRYLASDSDSDETALESDDVASESNSDQEESEDIHVALPMETIRDLNVNGQFTVGEFQVMGLKTQNFIAVLNANKGIVSLEPLDIELYEGKFDGSIKINAQGAKPKYHIATSLEDLTIGPFAKDLADFDLVNATGSFNLDIKTEGEWVSKLKRNLNGSIDVKLADAIIDGDMEGTMGVLLNLAENASKNDDGTSKFDAITAWLSIKDGLATTRNLNMTGAAIQVTGGGSFDIPTEYVDASPSISIAGSSDCPVVLKGKLAELDYAKAAQRAIPDCLKAKAKAEIDKTKAEAKAKVDEAKSEAKAKLKEEEKKAKQELEDKAKKELKKLFKF